MDPTIQRLRRKRALHEKREEQRQAELLKAELRGKLAARRRGRRRSMRATADWARNFSAAKSENIYADFQGAGGSINSWLYTDLRKLRARSRQEANDNPYVKRFLQMVRTHVVGPKGIALQAEFQDENGKPDEGDNTLIEGLWKEWGRSCDVTGQMTWVAMQALIAESVARDGEALVRLVPTNDNRFGLALQMVDPDVLDEKHVEELEGGRRVELGIEVNEWGRPVAYRLRFYRHQNGVLSMLMPRQGDELRIEAGDLLHVFIRHYPDQRRGVPWTHASILRLHMLGGYEEAECVAARLGAAKSGFYETETGEEFDGDDVDSDGAVLEDIEPGTIYQLPEGVKFKPFDPQHPTSAYGDFVTNVLQGIASGMGVSYSGLTSDVSKGNFSSQRVGLLEEREHWKALQVWLSNALHWPIYEAWFRMGMTNRSIPVPPRKRAKYQRIRWMPRGWPWIDPQKDLQASIIALEHGLTTRQEILAEKGLDWRDVLLQAKTEEDTIRQLGVTLALPGADPVAAAIASAASKPSDKPDAAEEAGEKPEADEGGANADKEKGLNGAQITAAKDVISDIIAGVMPPDVGEQLLVAVGLEPGVAQQMVAAAVSFAPKNPPEGAEPPEEELDEGGDED